MWLTILDQGPLVHDDDLIEVENRVETMRDGDDGVGRELAAEEALDESVRGGIQANDALAWYTRGDSC